MNRMNRAMNDDTFINRLLEQGLIERLETRGHYKLIGNTSRLQPNLVAGIVKRAHIFNLYGVEVAHNKYIFNSLHAAVLADTRSAEEARRRPIRHITRHEYGSQNRNVQAALARIPQEADGVRRSYGIEYEIFSLTTRQESELAYLLDTLPPHTTERDGSLSSSGVEIIFEPLNEEDSKRVIKVLAEFVREYDVEMHRTGMHITYGVSNSSIERNIDLRIRLNRLALALKSVATRAEIIHMFGRDFTDYARLPQSLEDSTRYVAFNGRNTSAWECRLVQWDCNIDKVFAFLKETEIVFHRPYEREDFIKLFELV